MIYDSDVDGGIGLMVTTTMTMTMNMAKVVGKADACLWRTPKVESGDQL